MLGMARDARDGSGWLEMARDGSRWLGMARDGSRWLEMGLGNLGSSHTTAKPLPLRGGIPTKALKTHHRHLQPAHKCPEMTKLPRSASALCVPWPRTPNQPAESTWTEGILAMKSLASCRCSCCCECCLCAFSCISIRGIHACARCSAQWAPVVCACLVIHITLPAYRMCSAGE